MGVAADARFFAQLRGPVQWPAQAQGILWKGRYKACLVDSGLLPDVQPIHRTHSGSRMDGGRPNEHPWSSYGANADGRTYPLLTPHPEYLGLGNDPASRSLAYRALFVEVLPDELVQEIRIHLQQRKAPGTDRFRSGLKQGPADSPPCDRPVALRDPGIVPDTFCLKPSNCP